MVQNNRRFVRLAAAAIIMICIGIIYMWSVFGGFVINEFGWSKADSGLTASIMITCFSVGSLIGGRAQDRIGPRTVSLIGIIGFFAGVFLSSYTVSMGPSALYLSFGVLGGFSVGCIYNSVMACIQKWFPDKVNMAMRIIVTCFGLATLVFSPLVAFIAAGNGIVPTFRIVAVIFLAVCLAGWTQIKNPEEGWQPEGFERKAASLSNQKQYTLVEALKTPQMWIMFLSVWFITATFFGINPVLKQLAAGRALDSTMATGVVMVTGLGMACGRLFFPAVVNKLGRRNTALVLAVIVLLSSMLLVFAQGYPFLVLVFIAAAGAGAPGAIWPTWTAENFGFKNNGANFGFILLAIGISSLTSLRISQALADAFFGGSDVAYFIYGSLMALLGIALILSFKPIKVESLEN